VHNPQPSDTELLERARVGEMDAFGELVSRHQDLAVGTAYFILGTDLKPRAPAQEALTRAFAALPRFRPDGSFRAWLLRIVVNEAFAGQSCCMRTASRWRLAIRQSRARA
jgi:RNA polymerase sigma-70 factor, ECF subfamily